jgi:hypothetical protein
MHQQVKTAGGKEFKMFLSLHNLEAEEATSFLRQEYEDLKAQGLFKEIVQQIIMMLEGQED